MSLIDGSNSINNDQIIMKYLQSKFFNIESLYVLSHIPDQCDNEYDIIINGKIVNRFIVDNNNNIERIFVESVDKYKIGLSKIKRIQLYLAIYLGNNL